MRPRRCGSSSLDPLAFRNLADGGGRARRRGDVVHGPNGAGKTNLLEAIFFALTGRSPRTRRERETIAFGEPLARVEAALEPTDGRSGATVRCWRRSRAARRGGAWSTARRRRPRTTARRPAIAVVHAGPARAGQGPAEPAPRPPRRLRRGAAPGPRRGPARLRRARWPSATTCSPGSAPARDPGSLDAWDRGAGRAPAPLVEARGEAAARAGAPFAAAAEELGLGRRREIAYRPRTGEPTPRGSSPSWRERRDADVGRGFSGYGPAPRRGRDLASAAARCAATARRASSGSACWRCSSPSARRCGRRGGSCR